MKKIAASLAMIAAVALFATAATTSYLSSNATLTGITFSTGNANLELSPICQGTWHNNTVSLYTFNYDVANGCQFNFNTSNWYPGKTQTDSLYLGNFSTSDIALNPTLMVNGLKQSIGGLNDVLWMRVYWSGNVVGTGMHPLSYYENNAVDLPQVAHNGKVGLNFTIEMDPAATNVYENQNVSFNLYFDAAQAY